MLEPTFGGINLEDIKAPECFYIEETLEGAMNIPVFHDDQHGTAIISGGGPAQRARAGRQEASSDVKVVFNGAGAAGIACAKLYVTLGVRRENIAAVSTARASIYKGRTEGMNQYKARFAAGDEGCARWPRRMAGADVFVGLSVGQAA